MDLLHQVGDVPLHSSFARVFTKNRDGFCQMLSASVGMVP